MQILLNSFNVITNLTTDDSASFRDLLSEASFTFGDHIDAALEEQDMFDHKGKNQISKDEKETQPSGHHSTVLVIVSKEKGEDKLLMK